MSNPEPERSLPPGDDSPYALGSSPYQTPAILEDDEDRKLDWGSEPIPAMPFVIPLMFAALASALMVGSLELGIADYYDLGFLVVVLSPMVFLGGFVLVCLQWYGATPLVIPRSTAWKFAMTTLVPPVSLLIFVPTCVGSTIFMVPSWKGSSSFLWMILPIGIAYFATAIVISRRLRHRFHVRKTAEQ